MRPWYVYIVECADRTLYTGIALDPLNRVDKHNKGAGAKYTRARRPVRLVYTEKALGRSEASKREYQIKQLRRQQKLDLISGSNINS